MLRSRLLLAAPLLAAALTLSACSTGSPGSGSGSSGANGSGGGGSSAAAPAGSVSTEGVCGLLSPSKVDAILGSKYVNSKETPLPAITMEDAAYCTYTPASGVGSLVIQVATSHAADAAGTMNDATGDVLTPQSGIGDSAMYSDTIPELVVIWGQTAIGVGQDVGSAATKKVTLAQLEKLATAVHAAG